MPIPFRLQPKKLSSPASDQGGGAGSSAVVRTQRALQILRLLQAGQSWSADELAVQFNCSTRTIFRDLQLLRECNIPIDTPPGARGIRLAHDFFWHPERPTLDEMTALVVGARMAEDSLPKDMQKNLDSALTKLVGSERPAVRQRLSELNMRIDAPHLASHPSLPGLDFLPQLLEYIGNQMPVRLTVQEAAPQQAGQALELIPVRLHYRDEQWQLIGVPVAGGAELSVPLTSIGQIAPLAIDVTPLLPAPLQAPNDQRATDQRRGAPDERPAEGNQPAPSDQHVRLFTPAT